MSSQSPLFRITAENRKSAVLTPSSLSCLSKTATVNLTRGCAHQCVYCYTRGYSSFPGEHTIAVYANTFEKMKAEWQRKRKIPDCVYFSPSSDIFQPIPEVLDMGYNILHWLLNNNVRIAILTKGVIPNRFFDLFAQFPEQIQFQHGLITLDNSILSMFEPGAASAETRISQMRRFIDLGITTRVRLDPILPGLTDDEESLESLCRELEQIGVREMAASVLFLRPVILASLKQNIHDNEIKQKLMSRFENKESLAIHAGQSRVFALCCEERRQILDRVRTIAALHQIECHRCSCKNPDLDSSSCQIAGAWTNRGNTLFDLL